MMFIFGWSFLRLFDCLYCLFMISTSNCHLILFENCAKAASLIVAAELVVIVSHVQSENFS